MTATMYIGRYQHYRLHIIVHTNVTFSYVCLLLAVYYLEAFPMADNFASKPAVTWVSEAAVTDCGTLTERWLTIITLTPGTVAGIDKVFSVTDTVPLSTNFNLASVKY